MYPPEARIIGGLREIHGAQTDAAQAQHLLFDAAPNRFQQPVRFIAA
ncbi:hypothetical protein [Candidatus Sodalis pierantonius]|nr:hypothetical protein [Candidatus Sodalis pierantonius]